MKKDFATRLDHVIGVLRPMESINGAEPVSRSVTYKDIKQAINELIALEKDLMENPPKVFINHYHDGEWHTAKSFPLEELVIWHDAQGPRVIHEGTVVTYDSQTEIKVVL